MENLYTKYVRHLRHFGEYVARLNAKLRELIEAAEWRDEVINFYTTPQIVFTKNGWRDRLDYENCRKADAEAAYQAALEAAKEGE